MRLGERTRELKVRRGLRRGVFDGFDVQTFYYGRGIGRSEKTDHHINIKWTATILLINKLTTFIIKNKTTS